MRQLSHPCTVYDDYIIMHHRTFQTFLGCLGKILIIIKLLSSHL